MAGTQSAALSVIFIRFKLQLSQKDLVLAYVLKMAKQPASKPPPTPRIALQTTGARAGNETEQRAWVSCGTPQTLQLRPAELSVSAAAEGGGDAAAVSRLRGVRPVVGRDGGWRRLDFEDT